MPYKANLTKRHHIKKHTYRQSNYSDYNNALKVKIGTRVETLELCLSTQEHERYKTHAKWCHVTLLSWLRMGLMNG